MMYSSRMRIFSVLLTCMVLAGCNATTSQKSTLGGALLGAAVGGILGGGEGALIGALVGSGVGWAAGTYLETRERTPDQDQQIYGYTRPTDAVFVKIRSVSIYPKTVNPGQTVEFLSDYSLATPEGQTEASVVVQSVLLKDGEILHEYPAETILKQSGGYATKLPINVPDGIDTGTYVVRHSIRSGPRRERG